MIHAVLASTGKSWQHNSHLAISNHALGPIHSGLSMGTAVILANATHYAKKFTAIAINIR